jgi:hypothetical protein
MAKVKAIKNIPIQPPILLAFSSMARLHDCGKVNSKYPKKEIANTIKMTKKMMLFLHL